MTGIGYVALLMLMMLGGIPSWDTWISTIMWCLWMLCVLGQIVFTLMAEVAFILAYISLETQYRGCMVEFSHGHALFNVILPAMLFHPAFISRSLAVLVYFGALYFGMARGREEDPSELGDSLLLPALFIVGPGALVGVVYFMFTLSVIFSLVFFVPIPLTLMFFALLAWFFLNLARSFFHECSRGLVGMGCVAKIVNKFIFQQVDGMLWWLDVNLESSIAETAEQFAFAFAAPMVLGLSFAPFFISASG